MHTLTLFPTLRLASPGLTALEELQANLEAAGLVEGKPDHVSEETLAIDAQALAEATCACGCVGLDMTPYHHPDREEYRIVAMCPRCLDCFEA